MVRNPGECDVIIVNTCTVTHNADRKSLYNLRKAMKANSHACVVVIGCGVDNKRIEWQRTPGVNYCLSNSEKSFLPDLLEAHAAGEKFEVRGKGDVFGYPDVEQIFHTRGLIKIQDGCDEFCSYCIIPHVRGPGVSRSLESILDNARSLLDRGYKELVLTGVNIGRWTWEGKGFTDLISRILEIPGNWRLSMGSLEPENFCEDFYKLFEHPRLSRHIHLSLQSGSDKILQNMNRRYSLRDFSKVIENLRRIDPLFHVTSDIIVGFPGEAQDDFSQSLEAIRNFNFGHVHIFSFSRRKGTQADLLPDQVDVRTLKERRLEMESLSYKIKKAFLTRFIGKTQYVLIEKENHGVYKGFGEHYVPLEVKSIEKMEKNKFYSILVSEFHEGTVPFLRGFQLNMT